MKNITNLFLASIVLLTASCSEVELVKPSIAEEDLQTSANYWKDQYIIIDITTSLDTDIEFYLLGAGSVNVHWGDGTSEQVNLTNEYAPLYHQYTGEQKYVIKIDGNIEGVKTFDMAYEEVQFNEIHFGGMTNLEEVSIHLLPRGPQVVNLSRNKALTRVNLVGIQGMNDLVLATANKISHIDIAGENSLTTAAVDRVIARIHDAVINNPRTGFFNLSKSWAPAEGEENVMVGPPSSYSINKLRKLQGLGWEVTPQVQ